MSATYEIEMVRVVLGIPENGAQKLHPVTIFDLTQRRVRYQLVAVEFAKQMQPLTHCLWHAIWLGDQWKLIDKVDEIGVAA